MEATTPQQPSCVDAADVLFLIVKHLRLCGLSASAMALLRESELDTSWLCGPSREMRLLREWVFTGDLERAKALLQPLAGALANEELSAAMVVIEKHQLLETFFLGGDGLTHKQRQAILDELRSRKRELRVDERELALCLRDLLQDTEARGAARCTVAAPSHRPWDVNEARMRCFEQLVPFFRGDIDPEDYEHKYLVVEPTQLMALVCDGAARKSVETASRAEQPLDCIGVASQSHQAALDQLARAAAPSQHLFLIEKQLPPQDGTTSISSHPLSRSVDWSKTKKSNWVDAIDLEPAVLKGSIKTAGERQNPLAMSLDFDKARLVTRRHREVTAGRVRNELIAEEDGEDTDEGEVDFPPSVLEEAEQESQLAAPTAKMLCDSATQTEVPAFTTVSAAQIVPAAVVVRGEPKTEQAMLVAAEPEIHQQEAPESTAPSHELDHSQGIQFQKVQLSAEMHRPERNQMAASFASDVSRSVCIDDDDDNEPSLSAVLDNKSPISKYLEEEDEDGEDDESNNDAADPVSDSQDELPEHRPERYDQLTLDHIVRASVVAEVKEAHAARAIDLNRDGSQLAIGTNARALRVFDITSPLASAASASASSMLAKSASSRSSFSSSPHHHSFLPLLPVIVERHKHHQTSIYCVAYNNSSSSDSNTALGVIASGDANSSIKVLSLATSKEVLIQSHVGKIRALHFTTDNLLWSTATGDLRIRCWDLSHSSSAPQSSCMDLDGHVGEIQALAFSAPTAQMLLSASLDKTIRLWDHRSGKCERIIARSLHPAFTLAFDPSSDSRHFASGHQDGSVALWDLRMKSRPLQSLAYHQDECRAISWSPDGAWLLSSSFDGTICVMQAQAQQLTGSAAQDTTLAPMASYHQHQDKVLQAQWHPTTPALVTTGADKLVKLWAFA